MKQIDAFELISQHMNEAVEQFGYPITERLEVALIKIGRRDLKLMTRMARKAGFDKANTEAVTKIAELLQDQWLQHQIEQQQKKRGEGTDPPAKE